MASIDERLVDKRIVERNIERGLVSEADFQKYLADLADLEQNADVIRLHDGFEDDDDEDDEDEDEDEED